ncbi:MAG: bifunctional sulfate adenylyltransferase/adenylylsulfate kinase [Gammaproteobacteria bacterium]|nr:bifunctional sulfate adenylyltransferase/adenylylsulfate kinase [Gammaproteobacteria bacterium]MCH9763104.1 bifunctional sulfate adenylyltransferase/adenylylsulfate kinase [Gammaproteobacteria bacterium]
MQKKSYWSLTKRQLCDVECLLNGAFSPLTGFLTEADYVSVCENMRLTNGVLWPMPITLDVSEDFAAQHTLGDSIVLVNDENLPIARLDVSSIWKPNKALEATQVFGTTDKLHPGVNYLYQEAGSWYMGGVLHVLSHPKHDDFQSYRHTPSELKQLFNYYGWSRIIAFQTRNPMHRAHFELTQRAAHQANAHVLIHPVVGMTKPGDIDYVLRIKCYEHILKYYPSQVMLSLLPLAMRMGGPREALWHAMIRKNYGATHFIVGRDHAGPGLNHDNQPFYDAYAAQKLVRAYQDEIEIELITSPEIVYVKEKAIFLNTEEVKPTDTVQSVSGTTLRRALKNRDVLPDWFSFPEVIQTLQTAYPPKYKQGFTLFFTGLSGAGKSTLAKAVRAKLQEDNLRAVTLLDGDVVRKHLSKGLGFSKADRDTNIERLGYVASEITKHRGIAICAAIAPYEAMRQSVRQRIMQYGGFIEIHVSTPISVCKSRDIKGLYQQAEEGLLSGFTGVDAPYDIPTNPELVIDTSELTVPDALERIFHVLKTQGFYTGQSMRNTSLEVALDR